MPWASMYNMAALISFSDTTLSGWYSNLTTTSQYQNGACIKSLNSSELNIFSWQHTSINLSGHSSNNHKALFNSWDWIIADSASNVLRLQMSESSKSNAFSGRNEATSSVLESGEGFGNTGEMIPVGRWSVWSHCLKWSRVLKSYLICRCYQRMSWICLKECSAHICNNSPMHPYCMKDKA